MGRVFLFCIGISALLCLIPIRCAVEATCERQLHGLICLYVGCFCVYARTIAFQRKEAGEYALLFYDKKGHLKNTVTLYPPPKKKKYTRRLWEKQEIGQLLYILFHRRHVRFVHLETVLAGGDAAHLAQVYGVLCAAAAPLQVWLLQQNIPLQQDFRADFSGQGTRVRVSCMVCDPVGKLIVSAIHAAKRRRKGEQQHGKTSHRKYHARHA